MRLTLSPLVNGIAYGIGDLKRLQLQFCFCTMSVESVWASHLRGFYRAQSWSKPNVFMRGAPRSSQGT